MGEIIFLVIVAFAFGFLFGAVYGVKRCTRILLNSPKVREVLGEEQWNAFMKQALKP